MWEGEFTTKGTTVQTVDGTVAAIDANPRRVGLIVSSDVSAFAINIAFAGGPDNNHIFRSVNNTPLLLWAKDAGPLVGYAAAVQATNAGVNVSFIEILALNRRVRRPREEGKPSG